MTDMVERATRAAWEAGTDLPFDLITDQDRKSLTIIIRAAIEAMREIEFGPHQKWCGWAAYAAWQKIIDDALSVEDCRYCNPSNKGE